MTTPMPTGRAVPLSPPEIEEFVSRLEEARRFHLARIEEGQASDLDDIRMAMLRRSEDALEEVEAALARIDSGHFGLCANCSGAIGHERLEAIPHTALCVNCVGS